MPQKQLICRLEYNEATKQVEAESAQAIGMTLEQIIQDDKKYGKMIPKNGKYFTVKVMDWQNKTITQKQLVKAIVYAWLRVEWEIKINCKLAKPGEYADFKVYFRKTSDDPLLTKTTLQYQYYPINTFTDPNRGVCVVNTDYPWTIHGDPISMFLIDDVHYKSDTIVKAASIDFDEVYFHEGCGHGLGLSHSPNTGKKMSWRLDLMAKFIDDEDPAEHVPRLGAKYEIRGWLSYFKLRLIKWYRYRSDNY